MLLVIRYLLIPMCFSLLVTSYVFLTGTHNQAENYGLFIYSLLFYGAPFIIFALLILILRPTNQIVHSGFIGITTGLLLISSFWLLPPDVSGLPIQWVMYWPLSAILGVLCIAIRVIFNRYKKLADGDNFL
jgi:hypothetical protein